jgi:hypothetical protein
MKRILVALLFLLGAAFNANAQSTTVSGTVTDTGAQAWANGTFTFQLVANPNFPNLASYTWTGGTLNQTISGSLNGSGAYSQSLPSNSAISPQGSKWQLKACPLATSPCFASANTTITGGAQTLNLTPPVIAINLQTPDQFVRAYADSEIVTAFIGGQYYNLISGVMRDCTTAVGQVCTVWANVGTGAGGPPTGPAGGALSGTYPNPSLANPITLPGSTSGSAQVGTAAVAGTPARINLPITTGTNGQFLKTDGGTPQQTSWSTIVATTPGGVNTNVQFNDGGVFGGDQDFIWDKITKSLTVGGTFTTPATSVISLFAGATGNSELTLFDTGILLQAVNGTIQIDATSDVILTANGTGKVKTGAAGRNSGQIIYVGTASGSAELGVAVAAGTPNRMNLPTTTGAVGSLIRTDGANPQQLSWITNCSSAASPAICGSSQAGSFAIPAAGTTVTVNTTAVTANSQIFVQQDDSLGTKLGVTCNTGILANPPAVTARTAGTSFTVSVTAGLAVNPVCFGYFIVN